MSWQTRSLAQFIAATVPQDPKNPDSGLMDAASVLSIDPDERKSLQTALGSAADSPSRTATPAGENKPGSFERLMQGFRATAPA